MSQLSLNFQRTWQVTKNTLDIISRQIQAHYRDRQNHKNYKLKGPVIEAYTNVYNLCISKPSYKDRVFQKYKESLTNFITDSFIRSSVNPIKDYNTLFDSYAIYIMTISRRIFAYLDRFYTPSLEECTLGRVGFNLFKQIVFSPSQQQFYFNSYVQRLGQIRDNKIIKNKQLLSFSQSLIVIDQTGLLNPLVEIFMKQTNSYYLYYLQKHKNDIPIQYLANLNNLFYFQSQLIPQVICLPLQQMQIANKMFDQVLVQQYTPTLIAHQKGLKSFLTNKDYISLKVIQTIYSKFQGFQRIRNGVYEFIIEKGQLLMDKLHHNQSLNKINQIYNFIKQWRQLIQIGFQDQGQIVISFKNALQKTISKSDNIEKELSAYIREKLDKGELQLYKEIIKSVFQIIPSKDQLLHFYSLSLQKKILDGSFIYVTEKGFANQLKQMCGSSDVVQNIDKKIQDYIDSLALISQYNICYPKSVIYNINLMNFQLWQKRFEDQIATNLCLIQPLLSIWNQFQSFYQKKQQKKKLTFLPLDSKIVMAVRFNSKWVTIKCNMLQASIIIFISQQMFRTQDQIILTLRVQKHLLTSFFQFPPPFISQIAIGIYKIDWDYSFQGILDLDSKIQEEIKMPKGIKQDREILIQASIIKCLKQKKQLHFQQIVEQVLKKITLFKPHASNIKLGLQKLIKNYFLQEINGLFKYLQ